jgi:hypothetical protein
LNHDDGIGNFFKWGKDPIRVYENWLHSIYEGWDHPNLKGGNWESRSTGRPGRGPAVFQKASGNLYHCTGFLSQGGPQC